MYSVPNDDNRAEDGISLRNRFYAESSIRLPYLGECTMLEFMIALAIRMNEVTYDYTNPWQVSYWFWLLIENLGIADCHDRKQKEALIKIPIVLNKVVDRSYDYNGVGGLFPINNPEEDQRTVEIWYQMMAYLEQNM